MQLSEHDAALGICIIFFLLMIVVVLAVVIKSFKDWFHGNDDDGDETGIFTA